MHTKCFRCTDKFQENTECLLSWKSYALVLIIPSKLFFFWGMLHVGSWTASWTEHLIHCGERCVTFSYSLNHISYNEKKIIRKSEKINLFLLWCNLQLNIFICLAWGNVKFSLLGQSFFCYSRNMTYFSLVYKNVLGNHIWNFTCNNCRAYSTLQCLLLHQHSLSILIKSIWYFFSSPGY